MRPYYLDTSALIKRYVTEAGSAWLEATAFAADDALLLTSSVTIVEIWSALARRRREASISHDHHADALNAFREDCVTRYRFIEFESSVIESSGHLLERYPLRAYDAVQLATALVTGRILADAALPVPIFLSADDRLLTVALAEGLPADNPNMHR